MHMHRNLYGKRYAREASALYNKAFIRSHVVMMTRVTERTTQATKCHEILYGRAAPMGSNTTQKWHALGWETLQRLASDTLIQFNIKDDCILVIGRFLSCGLSTTATVKYLHEENRIPTPKKKGQICQAYVREISKIKMAKILHASGCFIRIRVRVRVKHSLDWRSTATNIGDQDYTYIILVGTRRNNNVNITSKRRSDVVLPL